MNDKRKHWRRAGVAIGGAALLGVSAVAAVAAQPVANSAETPVAAANAVPQVAQAGATERAERHFVEGPSTVSRQFCQDGAAWVRPHFAGLTLKGADTVTVRASGGDSHTLTATHGTGRSLSTKSFSGNCVTVDAALSSAESRFTVDSLQTGTASADVVVAGAGDICGSNCTQTADVVKAINPAAVFTAGDNAYENGSLSDYRTRYDPAWGQFNNIVHPTPGNHEYQTSGATGYFDYFNGSGNPDGKAGPRGKGYYSWDVGDWHFVALNTGSSSSVPVSAGSAQEQWLRADLAASTKPCTAAYWHHPLFTRGSHSNSTFVKPLWDALYAHKADLILVGHDHNYQRYAPQRPDGAADATNGIRQVLVGTGGRAFYSFNKTQANVQAENDDTYGVLKLGLSSTGYRGDFVPVEGRTFTDTFTGTCKAKGNTTTPSYALSASPSAVGVVQGASASTKVTVTSSGGFNAATNLAVSGLPSGVTASVSPTSVTPPANGAAEATVTLNASSTAATGTANVTVTGTSGTLTKSTTVALTVNPSGGGGTCSGTNGTDVAIPDNTTVESSITISGCAGNASATSEAEVHIKHTYIGDLVVSLVAPDGTASVLHNKTGGDTDNLDQVYTVNLSGDVANGTWKLRVQDVASQDVGTIDTWSLNLGGGTTDPDDVFFDDFESDKGWQTNASATDDATTGKWERGDPEATTDNGDKQLGATTSGVNNLVTGRLAGTSAGTHDVDAGRTSITSPAITLPSGTLGLTLRWSVGFGANAAAADYLKITVGGSSSKVVLDQRGNGTHINGSWRTLTADLSEFAGQSVRILIEAVDDTGTPSLVEAQVDDVKITRA